MSVMLYQRGDEFKWEGIPLASVTVDESEVDAAIAAGWYLHPFDIPKEVKPEEVKPEEGKAEAPKRGRPRKEEANVAD